MDYIDFIIDGLFSPQRQTFNNYCINPSLQYTAHYNEFMWEYISLMCIWRAAIDKRFYSFKKESYE